MPVREIERLRPGDLLLTIRRGALSIKNLSVPFEDLFCQESAGGKILGEEMNEAPVLAKNLPFLWTELLRELEKL
jgi:hypothetical protein